MSDQTITIETVEGLFKAMATCRSSFGRDLWWRGQSAAKWSLICGIYRPGISDSERSLTARFVQKVPPRYPDHPAYDDFPGWLFLLQHYRFPTRLLDWSESPLTALYFAVTECPNEDGVLCALDPFKLNKLQFGKEVLFSDFSSEVHPLFAAALKAQSQDIPKVAALSSTERNIRMFVQMSRFTIHGFKEPLEKLETSEQFLQKIVIPAKTKPLFVDFLYDVGVRLSNLFPDLEHLAKDILGRAYQPA